jgi:hypothetical protein
MAGGRAVVGVMARVGERWVTDGAGSMGEPRAGAAALQPCPAALPPCMPAAGTDGPFGADRRAGCHRQVRPDTDPGGLNAQD